MSEALAGSCRLITLDSRGTAASQRDLASITIEGGVEDILAVVDSLHLKRFALLAQYPCTAPALMFAARYPERVDRFVLWHPRVAQRADAPTSASPLTRTGACTRAPRRETN